MPTTARLRLLLATACLAIAPTAPANAALFQQVYTGTVTSGYDPFGFFGAGADLTGLAYTATYLIDDSKGRRDSAYEDDGAGSYYTSADRIYGGLRNYTNDPVSAKFTISGRAVSVSGNYGSDVYKYAYNPEYYGVINDKTFSYAEGMDGLYNKINTVLSTSASYDSSEMLKPDLFAVDALIPASGYGYFSRDGEDASTRIYANFNVTSFSSGPAAVAEPAAWALMIGGFGLVGGTLRRTGRVTKKLFATA